MLKVKFKFPQAIFTTLFTHAKKTAPEEGCGILAGKDFMITEFFPLENTAHSEQFYEMKAEEQFQIIKKIRAKGLKMIGIFHSHPVSLARPSATDIKLAFYPDVLYFILSLQNPNKPVLKAFWIKDGEVEEEGIEIINEAKASKSSVKLGRNFTKR